MDSWYYKIASRFPAANSQEKWIQAGNGPAACFWDGWKGGGAIRKANTSGGPGEMQQS